jgi:hypothetical protein
MRRSSLALVFIVGCGSGESGGPDATTDAPNDDALLVDAGQDGADAAPATPTIVASGLKYPWCLAADANNLYYCSGPDVFSVPKAGGSPTNLATNPNQANDFSIGVSASALYVLDGAGMIGKVPLPGGGWSWVSKNVQSPGFGVVVADSAYWVAQLAGNVMRVDPDAGTSTAVVTAQTSPAEIVGDTSALFWINQSATGAVMAKTLPSGAATSLATANNARHVAFDAQNVYYIAASGNFLGVLEVPRTGGQVKTILGVDAGLPVGIAPLALTSDGVAVYATTTPSPAIYKVALSGGGSPVQSTAANATHILADATSLYWIEGDQVTGASIKKMPKP